MRRRARGAIAIPLAIACTVSDPSPTPDQPPPPSTPVAAPEPGRSPADVRAHGNHLVGEPSPYLEQHAHNPVDWYPWGPEAIAKAQREGKPIFLSIGYSTCHWCHVMERESFEDDEVAAYLNANFVSIKVDREWRPDIDAIYIDAVAALGGSTGWPLTVFLTPELEPFFGGTYYPRHAQGGRPGFLDVLHEVHGTWTSEGERAAERGREVLARIEAQARAGVKSPAGLGAQTIDEAMRTLASARDTTEGGFGRRQKFPNAPLLLAQLRHVRRTGDASTRAHLVLTLEQMMRGGLRDHVGGGFHRYTVDAGWHLPHFEKTLYDNAQLAAVYVEAGRVLERDDFVATGRAALDELIEAWQEPSGGFVVGFDADDPGGEGAFYAWKPADLEAALGPEDAKLVAALFGVSARGEAELEGASVLHRRPDADVAVELRITREALATASTRALAAMKTARARRPGPRRDDKLLAGWNGLAIAALADAGRWLDEPRYVDAARRAGAFVVDRCWQDGRMLRGRRGDTSLGEGVLEDYALVGLGLVRLHAATGDPQWLTHARAIGTAIVERFHDPDAHAFMRTPKGAEGVPIRMVDLSDGVLPSGGSSAIALLLELGALSGDGALHELALDMLQRVAGSAVARPTQSGFLLVVLDHATAPVREVVLAGDESDPRLADLWREVRPSDHARVLPVRVPAAGAAPDLSAAFPALQGKTAREDRPTAYVCEQGRCELPTSDPKRLREQLDAAFAGDALAQAARPRG